MTPELTTRLCNAYPKIFPDGDFEFECQSGWFHVIWNLCEDLQRLADKQGCQPVAHQVKEKFGGLRFYVSEETPEMSKAITRYEHISQEVCEACGKYGATVAGKGWLKAYCEEHHGE